MKKIYAVSSVVLISISLLAFYGGSFAHQTVKDQLSAQNIRFPDKTTLEKDNPKLVAYAGATVDTGTEAKAYSDYIKGHLAKVADGKTYSEVSSEFQKDKTNKTLEGQRMTLFMGETLRGLLLNAWGWGLVGDIAKLAALALGTTGVLALLYGIKLYSQKKTVAAKRSSKNKKK